MFIQRSNTEFQKIFGGYGTGNDYGDSWFSKLLKLFVKNSINFPPLYSVQVCGELKALGELELKRRLVLIVASYD